MFIGGLLELKVLLPAFQSSLVHIYPGVHSTLMYLPRMASSFFPCLSLIISNITSLECFNAPAYLLELRHCAALFAASVREAASSDAVITWLILLACIGDVSFPDGCSKWRERRPPPPRTAYPDGGGSNQRKVKCEGFQEMRRSAEALRERIIIKNSPRPTRDILLPLRRRGNLRGGENGIPGSTLHFTSPPYRTWPEK